MTNDAMRAKRDAFIESCTQLNDDKPSKLNQQMNLGAGWDAASALYEAEMAQAESRNLTIKNLRARNAELVAGLKSIAANSCCETCQEAKLVAQSVLAKAGHSE